MRYILFGFQTDMSQYMISQIAFYFLWIGAFFLVNGQMLERIMMEKRYMELIRCGTYRSWWRRIIGYLFKINLVETVCVCMGYYLYSYRKEDFVYSQKIVQAGGLWFLGLMIAGMIQMLCNFYWKHGVKLGFPLLILIEGLSVYGSVFSKKIACFMPGSYFMLERSTLYHEQGYSYGICISMEILCILLIGTMGYKFGGQYD